MPLPSQEHTSTHLQRRQAARLEQLIDYVAEPYFFLTCKSCRVALPLSRVPAHFSSPKYHPYSYKDCADALKAWQDLHLWKRPVKLRNEDDLRDWSFPVPLLAPIPQLRTLYAFHCRYSDPNTGQRCNMILSARIGIRRHYIQVHGRDGTTLTSKGIRPSHNLRHLKDQDDLWEPNVVCQRLTLTGNGSRLWRVAVTESTCDQQILPITTQSSGIIGGLTCAWGRMEARLDRQLVEPASSVAGSTSHRYPTHLSPWLEKTRWQEQLAGQSLPKIADLLRPPEAHEVGLQSLLRNFDALIDEARQSVLTEEVNVFALHRINSFIGGRPYKKPLHTKLLNGTYRKYQGVWHKLLSYVYRLVIVRQQPEIHYVLTQAQLDALSQLSNQQEGSASSNTAMDQQRCLDLCIALLDHKLHGKLTDSIVVGFLAVLGINKNRDGFDDAVLYTAKLSGIVKLAQLLVVQHAVVENKAGRTQFPNELVSELQDRFMVYGSNSPMNWILNLRAYGAKLRDNTTSSGFIYWSDDGQKLSYRSLEFTMNSLRWFLHDQVEEACQILHDLLLLPKGDADRRAERLPQVHLFSLKDDPTVHQANYSFLQDPRNEKILGGQERYLLGQVRQSPQLRRQFFNDSEKLLWNQKHVKRYIQLMQAFLRRLLLLVHITGGQPARGTELLILRWRNSARCETRNIFIENGLVSFVTSYHKNYAATNSTKIIHRYLPSEIGEMLVYYLWLVLPFAEQLHILAGLPASAELGSFLWPASLNMRHTAKTKGATQNDKFLREVDKTAHKFTASVEEPWESAQLGLVIKEAFRRGLRTEANTLLWRHASIAISRRHLPEGYKFKRDYGLDKESSAIDLQAAHTSRMAGSCYARDVREAHGHVASIRAEYRQLSRSWHTCMGFGVLLPPRDELKGFTIKPTITASAQEPTHSTYNGNKRTQEELEKELNSWMQEEAVLPVKRQRLPYKLRRKCEKDSMGTIDVQSIDNLA
jgi:hypothetical protein